METGFVPTDTIRLIKWLLQTANENNWTAVFEYLTNEDIHFLTNNAIATSLPESRYNYDSETCKLVAVEHLSFDDKFIEEILLKTHVLALYDDNEMIFLAADDYHEDCFTCSQSFYDKYHIVLHDNGLVL